MRRLLYIVTMVPFCAFSQAGINTTTPQRTLHVNGTLQVDNEINVGGDAATAGSPGVAGQFLVSNGAGQAPQWKDLSLAPSEIGTIIVVDGQFVVAQEITVQLSADYSGASAASSATPSYIGNFTNKILDNQNKYTSNATTNSFQVTSDGIYEVYLNMQLTTTTGTYPTVGIWDDTTGTWVTDVNDYYYTTNNAQTYTLITSVPMYAARTYSFRATNTANYTIKQLSFGTTGSGPVSQVTVRRLK